MCEWTLSDGTKHNEVDYAEPDGSHGWRDFPHKQKVISVKLAKRIITPDTYRIPGEQIKGMAIHWIGTASPGSVIPYVAREIMIVQKNRKAMCFCLNLKSGRWHDYMENLKCPERPHLYSYDLSVYGM